MELNEVEITFQNIVERLDKLELNERERAEPPQAEIKRPSTPERPVFDHPLKTRISDAYWLLLSADGGGKALREKLFEARWETVARRMLDSGHAITRADVEDTVYVAGILELLDGHLRVREKTAVHGLSVSKFYLELPATDRLGVAILGAMRDDGALEDIEAGLTEAGYVE